jgi:hypothetical protein
MAASLNWKNECLETPPTTSYARDLTRNTGPCSKLRDTISSSMYRAAPQGVVVFVFMSFYWNLLSR